MCWERKGEFVCVCVCLYWGVGGGGLEWEKGGEGVGGEDKRALSALLILYFSSGGCGAFPCFLLCGLPSQSEGNWQMPRKHTHAHNCWLSLSFTSTHNTHLQTIICLHSHKHSHAQTERDCGTFVQILSCLFLSHIPKLTHTDAQAPKVTLGCHCTPRQTAYYHTVRRKFQRQNKTKAVVKKQEEGRWRDGRVWNKAQEQKK